MRVACKHPRHILRQTIIENWQMRRNNFAWYVARSTAVVLGVVLEVVAGDLLAGDIGPRDTFWITRRLSSRRRSVGIQVEPLPRSARLRLRGHS